MFNFDTNLIIIQYLFKYQFRRMCMVAEVTMQ